MGYGRIAEAVTELVNDPFIRIMGVVLMLLILNVLLAFACERRR